MTLNCPPPQVVFQSLISTYSNDKLLRSKFSSPEQVWRPCPRPCPRPRGAQPLLPRARASSGARLSETCECCAHGWGQGRLSVACERTCRAARTARVPVAVNPPLHHDATHPDMFLLARCVILSAQTRADSCRAAISFAVLRIKRFRRWRLAGAPASALALSASAARHCLVVPCSYAGKPLPVRGAMARACLPKNAMVRDLSMVLTKI